MWTYLGDQETLLTDNIDKSATEATVEYLVTGDEYDMHVHAHNVAGGSASSNEELVFIVAKPGPVTDADVTAWSGNSVTVTWKAPEDNGGTNNLKYKVDVTNSQNVQPQEMTEESFEIVAADYGLAVGDEFTVKIYACNEEWESEVLTLT